jgi:hypothetical protein
LCPGGKPLVTEWVDRQTDRQTDKAGNESYVIVSTCQFQTHVKPCIVTHISVSDPNQPPTHPSHQPNGMTLSYSSSNSTQPTTLSHIVPTLHTNKLVFQNGSKSQTLLINIQLLQPNAIIFLSSHKIRRDWPPLQTVRIQVSPPL